MSPPSRRNDVGDLRLRAATGDGAGEHESAGLQLEVQLLLADGTPFTVTTRITVRASGEPREVALGGVLLEGTTPTSLELDLAARLDPETGELTIQARRGNFVLTLVAQVGTPPSSPSSPEQTEPWPAQDIWVWVPSEALRQVQVSGAPTIDRARVSLPDDWGQGSVYALATGQTLTLETKRRGEATPEPNVVSLSRDLWLDVDGTGFTARDSIRGRMNRSFRLDLTEGLLGRVSIDGEGQVITELEGRRGVEIRERDLDVSANLRLDEARSSLPAVGWSEDVSSLQATLHLPPGWTLLTATGVDEMSDTWLDQWDLWSIFFVLVMSLAVGRLSNVPLGLLTLVTLTLCYHEPGAPFVSWIVLVPLLALRQVIPAGVRQKAASALFWCSVVLLLWVATPFGVSQLRHALYPFTAQTLPGWLEETRGIRGPQMQEVEVPEWMLEPGPEEGDEGSMARAAATEVRSPDDAPLAEDRNRSRWFDPNAIAQTGPGVPTWHFQQHDLRWSGPVRADHRLTLYVVPPWLFRLLALMRLLLLAGLIVVLLTRYVPRPPAAKQDAPGDGPPAEAPSAETPSGTAMAGATVALLLVSFAGVSPVAAQPIPRTSQLEQLAARIQRAPECGEGCVLVTEASVTLGADAQLSVVLQAHASARVGLRLPGPATRWVPDTVRVDGRATTALRRDSDNSLFVRLEEGVHRVELEGRVRGDALTLGLGEEPARVRVTAEGWSVDGVRPDGSASETIQLQRRLRVESEDETAGEVADLPSRIMVWRRLELGVRWTMHTEVQRVGGSASSTVLRRPLLEGESVTDANVRVEQGVLSVTVRGTSPVSWTSTLEPGDHSILQAGEGKRYSESWHLACSPIWRCETEGGAPYELDDVHVAHSYHPWPGERLTVRTSRPPGAEGRARTVQRALLELTPGVIMPSAQFELGVRASHGERQTIALSQGAAVQSLSVNGARRPMQLADDGALSVNVPPGVSTVKVEWQQPGGLEAFFDSPAVGLGGDLVNARVSIELPQDHWILWAHGPGSGAAVLFWPYLLLVPGIAFVLGRTRRTPLGVGEWILLGIGRTQVPALAALVVVGWFLLMDMRAKTPNIGRALFTVRQLGLAGYTFVAACCLYAALRMGLLMQPDMQITSLEGGPGQLAWYVDRATDAMPRAGVVSVPLWVWRVLMLGWALWLALRLFTWGKWGWKSFSSGGWITGGVAHATTVPVAATIWVSRSHRRPLLQRRPRQPRSPWRPRQAMRPKSPNRSSRGACRSENVRIRGCFHNLVT